MDHRAYYTTSGVLSDSNRSLASSSRFSHSDRILHWLDLLDAIYVIRATRYNSPTCSQAINNRCCNTLQRWIVHNGSLVSTPRWSDRPSTWLQGCSFEYRRSECGLDLCYNRPLFIPIGDSDRLQCRPNYDICDNEGHELTKTELIAIAGTKVMNAVSDVQKFQNTKPACQKLARRKWSNWDQKHCTITLPFWNARNRQLSR